LKLYLENMKKLILITTALCLSMAIYGQNEKFVNAIKKQISILDTAQKAETLSNLANTFERIAKAEKKEWTAYYYTAYALIRKSYTSKETKSYDEWADNAEKYVKLADSLSPNNSEISCLKSMVSGMRMMVDPMTRGMQYGMESGQWISKAKEQDPNNPRPYMLSGQAKFFTPAQWGGGKDKAKVELEEAQKRFDSFKPKTEVDPNWGKTYNEQLLKKCSE
jgi:hypothetical protein